MASSSKATTEFRRRRKLNLIKACGNQCNLCGYNKDVSALEFHHIDPTLKEYGISAKGTCHQLEKDLAEAKKCILVCANCHREIHSGLYSTEELYEKKLFDEQIAQTLINERNALYTKTHYYCQNCGKELSGATKTNLCPECYKVSTRKIERPSREELKELIQQYTFTELGRKYGIADNSVRKWCKVYNLPFRKKDIEQTTDWENI